MHIKKYRNFQKFYEQGLHFKCTGCGSCCGGAPGFVYLSEEDIINISEYLRIDKISFIKKYTIIVRIFGEKRLSLREKSNYDCIFLKDESCLIYQIRPYQCSSYPFWKKNVESEKSWHNVTRECKGVNNGKLYTKEDIDKIISETPNYNILKFKVTKNVKI